MGAIWAQRDGFTAGYSTAGNQQPQCIVPPLAVICVVAVVVVGAGLIMIGGHLVVSHPADKLPKGGEFPYVPPKQSGNPPVVPAPGRKGYVDKKGRIWE
jgi:hypothetical protein